MIERKEFYFEQTGFDEATGHGQYEERTRDMTDERELEMRNKLEDQLKKERARKERKLKMDGAIKNLQKAVGDFYTVADIPNNTCYLGGFANIYKGIERIRNAVDWGEEHRHEDD